MGDIEIDETILTKEVIHQMMSANEGVPASTINQGKRLWYWCRRLQKNVRVLTQESPCYSGRPYHTMLYRNQYRFDGVR